MRAVWLVVAWLGASPARAGDPEAHAAAAIRAAKVVADRPAYRTGVGAPRWNGVPQDGLFPIDTDGREDCPYEPDAPFAVISCPYTHVNGYAINLPDNWRCTDHRQPPAMTAANAGRTPVQVGFTELFATRTSEAALVCNWNHFVDNAALPESANRDASRAYETTRDWARSILTRIEERGGDATYACDRDTWETYYGRSVAALHYAQDAATEHHAAGNVACADNHLVPPFSGRPIYKIDEAVRCMDFVAGTLNDALGQDPVFWCDEAIAEGPRDAVVLSPKLESVVSNACGVGRSGVPVLTLACMGLERTLRHHCSLEAPKSLTCHGPPNDHSQAVSNVTWCEGERFTAPGGEDFLAAAVGATVPLLEEAVEAWATTCKQPDDPCDAATCEDWCFRTEQLAGYCGNEEPDDGCILHTCTCGPFEACGAAGQPCCVDGLGCDGDLECGQQTGTCVEDGAEVCSCDTTPKTTTGHTAITATEPTDTCAWGPCHYASAIYLLRFAYEEGASTYVVQSYGVRMGIYDTGLVLEPFRPGRLSGSYFTHAEALANLPGYDQVPPLADDERIFMVSMMTSDVIRAQDPNTQQAWDEDLAWWYGQVAQVDLELVPQCDP